MHRIVSVPGSEPPEKFSLVEQPNAPVLFLTSASTDINTLSKTLEDPNFKKWDGKIRALELSALNHPAKVDHYISNTANKTVIIIVRLLGGKSHWGYGLGKLSTWQGYKSNRKLIVLSGTKDDEKELHDLSTIAEEDVNYMASLLREGGSENMKVFLKLLDRVYKLQTTGHQERKLTKIADPYKWDWRNEEGPRVGIIYYRALYKAGDTYLPETLNSSLRNQGIVPRALCVSSLNSSKIKRAIINLLKEEEIQAILMMTAFSSVKIENAYRGSELWGTLNVPLLQILTSSNSKSDWEESSIGLTPIDLSIQIVLPELDGRIITRPCGFKEVQTLDKNLCTAINTLKPYQPSIEWVVNHTNAIINLRKTHNRNKKIVLILSNYPIKDGRIANGVGLDTPESVVQILIWLKENDYNLGKFEIPRNSKELINLIQRSRTNSPESSHKPPLTYLNYDLYFNWWKKLNEKAKGPIIDRWGEPRESQELEKDGFPINGIVFGNVAILIQPSRGYDATRIEDIHSPDLPPPHRYLAQYYWINNIFKADAISHIGKHGTAEWLPGKGVGMSEVCYPNLILGTSPHVYPFIVNDPGEGSQAKRRGQSLIIDHLTPPLGRAELYGELLKLDSLLDEYYTARELGSERSDILEDKILEIVRITEIDKVISRTNDKSENNQEDFFSSIDSYLCELKESQIKKGLHIFGTSPAKSQLLELTLCICKSPTLYKKGITQIISDRLNLDLDPWCDEEEKALSGNDKKILSRYINKPIIKTGDTIEWLDQIALSLIELVIDPDIETSKIVPKEVLHLLSDPEAQAILVPAIKQNWSRLNRSPTNEKESFLRAFEGEYIQAGPSGAPTKGRGDVLPTGRNFFSIDLRGLPTESAWDLGRRSAEQILSIYLLDNGDHLKHMALSVWGTATMRNGGEDIAQLLALIGVKPIWDGPTRRMIDIEVIPLNILQRPRVDVTLRISGLFRDAFPNLIKIVHRAILIVGQLDEPKDQNPYAQICRDNESTNRIFGSAPGSYGAGLQELINSGQWETKDDLAEAYISWSKWSYESDLTIKEDNVGFRDTLGRVQVVIHNQDNREHDILDSDDYYQFQGGLSAAVEKISGKRPKLLFGDHSRIERPKVRLLSQEVDKVVRSRVLNPNWLRGVKSHSYKGAFEMSATLDYLFAYDATTNIVPDWCYKAIYSNWVLDKSTSEFLKSENPWAFRDIAERLLEASNRDLWQDATDEEIQEIKSIINEAEGIIETMN
ncbi:cobaltochelatase subunit CobN [Prochlorococcus sp. MIT 1341]|uniref:cobaltochelatase subunit CobN n=1 Tax=Prochlorococcus sp. MIT 1341 TaxID=3096221 RepID=UPI002A7499C3|nr:cobaltochelatase subunit CobN [Prochlorococcus sp. MIT 1341]